MSPAPLVALSSNVAWNLHNFRRPIIEALLQRGYRVVLVCPADETLPALLAMGCSHVELPIDPQSVHPLHDLRTMAAYRSIYSHLRPALAMHFTIKPVIYGGITCRVLGIPAIHNITGLGTAFLHNGWMTCVAQWLYRRSLPYATRVFFQNEDDRNLFVARRLLRNAQTMLLPGSGVDTAHFAFASLPPRDGTALTFLFVGRTLRDKGVGEYVDAARRIKAVHPTVRFQLLGAADAANRSAYSAAEVQTWVDEGLLEYLGVMSDVRPALVAADCVVLPSYREGTSRALLEAASMGRPLVATDVPGCREVVQDGVNGLLCTPRDAVDLAHRLLDFISLAPERRIEMGRAGRRRVEEGFAVPIVVDLIMKEVVAVLGASAAPH